VAKNFTKIIKKRNPNSWEIENCQRVQQVGFRLRSPLLFVIYAAGNDPLPTWYIRKGKYIYIYEEKIGTAHKTQWGGGERKVENGKWKSGAHLKVLEALGHLQATRRTQPTPCSTAETQCTRSRRWLCRSVSGLGSQRSAI